MIFKAFSKRSNIWWLWGDIVEMCFPEFHDGHGFQTGDGGNADSISFIAEDTNVQPNKNTTTVWLKNKYGKSFIIHYDDAAYLCNDDGKTIEKLTYNPAI